MSGRAKTALQTPRFNNSVSFRSAKIHVEKKKKIASKTQRNSRSYKMESSPSTLSYRDPDYDEFNDELTLENEFNHLTHEIAILQCEVKPLRQNYLRLQNDILVHHRAIAATDEEVFTDSDALNAAVTAGDFSSAIVQFQNESDSLSHQVNQVKQLFSQNSLRIMRQEVEDGENHCAILAASVAETEREIQKNITQYETYKLSSMYEDVQIQKEKVYHLSSQLDEAMQIHSKLKSEHYLLTDTSHEGSAFLDEATTITKLNRKLSAARRKHFEQCELLITVRSKQLKEIEAVGGAIQMKQYSAASLQTLSQFQSLSSDF